MSNINNTTLVHYTTSKPLQKYIFFVKLPRILKIICVRSHFYQTTL